MALQRRFPVATGDVFPAGAYVKGEVEPVADFDGQVGGDGSRPQMRDKETLLPLWQVTVLDADESAGKRDTALSIKIAAQVKPVLPDNPTPFPWTPVEFTGLTALPYVDDSSGRPRIAWSFRAAGITAPDSGKAGRPRAVAS